MSTKKTTNKCKIRKTKRKREKIVQTAICAKINLGILGANNIFFSLIFVSLSNKKKKKKLQNFALLFSLKKTKKKPKTKKMKTKKYCIHRVRFLRQFTASS